MPASFLVELEKREKERTGIPNLRVAYNRVHGYYIEVTNSHTRKGARRLPPPADAEERRALHHAGAEDLRGQGALGARPRARAGEVAVRGGARGAAGAPAAAAEDRRARSRSSTCCACFSATARQDATTAGRISPTEICIEIEGGRHPVVEAQIENFIANDCRLSPARQLLLITGPNMGGKSTYMRQVALIVLMAHIGCVRAGAAPRASGRSTRSSPASARPTTWPAGARPSWWR